MFRLVAASCFLAATVPLPANETGKEWVHVVETQRVEFTPGGTIRITGSNGDLNVEGWDRAEVEVTIKKSTQRLYPREKVDDAEQRLRRVGVGLRRKSAAELDIATIFPSRSLKRIRGGRSDLILEYQVHAPRNSHLVIHHGSGAVTLTGMVGEIEATAKVGDIVLLLPRGETYAIDAKSRVGGVHSDLEHAATRRFRAARQLSVELPPQQRRIWLRVGIGDVTVLNLP